MITKCLKSPIIKYKVDLGSVNIYADKGFEGVQERESRGGRMNEKKNGDLKKKGLLHEYCIDLVKCISTNWQIQVTILEG